MSSKQSQQLRMLVAEWLVIKTKMHTYSYRIRLYPIYIFKGNCIRQRVFQINLAFKYLVYFYHVLRHLNYNTFQCFLINIFIYSHAGKQTGPIAQLNRFSVMSKFKLTPLQEQNSALSMVCFKLFNAGTKFVLLIYFSCASILYWVEMAESTGWRRRLLVGDI